MNRKIYADPIAVYVGIEAGRLSNLYVANGDLKDNRGYVYYTKGVNFSPEPNDNDGWVEGEELDEYPSVLEIYYASGELSLDSDHPQVIADQKRLVQTIINRCNSQGWLWTIASSVYTDEDFQ